MAEGLYNNGKGFGDIERHRLVWNLIFDKRAGALSAEEYAAIYSVSGENWRAIYQENTTSKQAV